MFGLISTLVLGLSFTLAITVIAWMFLQYREKIVAALLIEPMPQTVRVYEVRVSRPRVRPVQIQRVNPVLTALSV